MKKNKVKKLGHKNLEMRKNREAVPLTKAMVLRILGVLASRKR